MSKTVKFPTQKAEEEQPMMKQIKHTYVVVANESVKELTKEVNLALQNDHFLAGSLIFAGEKFVQPLIQEEAIYIEAPIPTPPEEEPEA